MPFWKKHIKCLVLVLVAGLGLIICAPYHNFQDYLSQGDHGRDLYAAQAVYRGELPYRDFWWVYGPLTPYYYGLFFKVFGTKISSMILGKLLLRIIGGLLICLAMMEITTPIISLLCACWFMLFHQDFFFTYNHLAGIVMVLGVAYCLLSYLKKNSIKAAWGSLAFIFTLCLIKINFGLAALAVSLIGVAVCDRVRGLKATLPKKIFYTAALGALPFLVFMIYYSLLKGLSIMEIRQCLPYMEGDQPYTTLPWVAIVYFIQITLHTITSNWTNFAFAVIINASAGRCIYLFANNKFPQKSKINFLMSLGLLSLFYVANFHEFLKSGVLYRAYWAQPLSIMIIFLLIDTATQNFNKKVRVLVLTFITAVAIYSCYTLYNSINAFKTQKQFLSLPRGQIYISNASAWIDTVEKTTQFLNQTLKPNELFFALPYDCLYYYLTEKKTPTRQLIFFDHIKIPLEQECAVLAQLEKNNTNYVVLSSRAYATKEPGLGILGKTYCPLIGKYIQDNFVPIARFGDWKNEPGWAWNHGTIILKRKVD